MKQSAPNPFRPTFGLSPPVVAGRYDLLEQFRIGLIEGPGSPARALLYVGPRGSGKTVLLNELEVVAGEQGWYAIAETASASVPASSAGAATNRVPVSAPS